MAETNEETRLRRAMEEVLRMARTAPNDRESAGSRTWRRDIETIAEVALYPPEMLFKARGEANHG